MDIKELHQKVLAVGRQREKGTPNKLSPEDLDVIIGTVAYFGHDSHVGFLAFDLKKAKYKIWDWLGMCLTGRMGDIEPGTEGQNVFVALGVIYTNVNSMTEFIDFLRYMDLQLWEGEFNTEKFENAVKEWVKDDEKLKLNEKKEVKEQG